MEEIIQSITEAEAEAAQIKANAQDRAAQIIAGAQANAQQVAQNTESECKVLRETGIRNAEKTAQANYDKAIAESAASAKKYADGVIKTVDNQVNEIVGRIVGGNR